MPRAAAVLTPTERLQLQTTQGQGIYWRDLDSRMRGSVQAALLPNRGSNS